jgi:hypothetical protein
MKNLNLIAIQEVCVIKIESGAYSQLLENDMWEAVGQDYDRDYDFDELLAKIKSEDFFRPFSERLLAFYNETRQGNYSAEEAVAYLLRRKTAVNRNTLKNWFTGKTEPKFGDQYRQSMFALAFALELDLNQTERLFHKVFLDKAFNKRNVSEFMYLYCIHNHKPLAVAESLIEQVDVMNISTALKDQTEQTQFLDDAAKQSMGEDELLRFVNTHQHNFSLNNTAAKKYKQDMLDKLTGMSGSSGLAAMEFERRRVELIDKEDATGTDNRDIKSIDFLLYMITGVDFARKENKEIYSIRDKFPREISNQFPDKQTLSSKDPSSYILRKDIIFLYFYLYWVTDYLGGQNNGAYDSFVEELNDILFDCGFSPLYIGNPYDWLFLFCSACGDNPLDIFRGIIAQD